MQRTIFSFSIEDIAQFKQQLLCWSQLFETAIFLDSNNYQQQYTSFDAVLAVDEFTCIKTDFHNAFGKLQEYQSITKDYIFGYISYDAIQYFENIKINDKSSENKIPEIYYAVYQNIIAINTDGLSASIVPGEIDIHPFDAHPSNYILDFTNFHFLIHPESSVLADA